MARMRYRRVILVKDTIAYYLCPTNALIVKGGFRAGKLLKIDLAKSVQMGGSKFYLVTNVKHENVYVHLAKGDFKPLKFSGKLLKSGNAGAMQKAVAVVVSKTETPKSSADGLCHYDDAAFDGDDGFVFVHEDPEELSGIQKKALLLKHKLSSPIKNQELAEKVRRFNDIIRHNSKGTGNGRAFN